MPRPPAVLLAAALGLALPVLAGPALAGPALAAPAAGGPTVTLEPTQHYVVGGDVDNLVDPDFGDVWESVPMQFRWRASAPAGICRQTVTQQNYNTLGGGTDPVLGSDTSTARVPNSARSTAVGVSNVFDYERGSDKAVVRVTDCKGRTVTSRVAQAVVGVREDTDPRWSARGSWSTARFSGFTDGTTRWTAQPGAALTTTVRGGAVGLVMERAADRGQADIYVDGTRRARVDTRADPTVHRTFVWETVLPAGTHTLKIVAVGTPGRPRVDVDALFAL